MSPTTPSIDIRTVKNYLDWQYAIHGGTATGETHAALVREERPCPTLAEARAAMSRLEGLALALELPDVPAS